MSHSTPQDAEGTERSARTLVIPSSVQDLATFFFPNAETVETIIFQAGSAIRRLKSKSFVFFSLVKWICIPPSVTIIESYCFSSGSSLYFPFSLETITFEPGSHLREIQHNAFCGRISLKLVSLPASVEVMDALSFASSRIEKIEISPGNRHFRTTGDLIVNSKGSTVHYFGTGSEVGIPDEIQSLGKYSFERNMRIVRIVFGPASGLSSIDEWALSGCFNLKSIEFPPSLCDLGCRCFEGCSSLRTLSLISNRRLRTIPVQAFAMCRSLESVALPSSLEVIEWRGFANCPNLATISFPPDSKLLRTGRDAFSGSWALRSVTLPASLEIIEPGSFHQCRSLATVTFMEPSRLVRIENMAFAGCPSLQSFFIPSTVQFVGKSCFANCDSLSSLAFGSPSQVRELLDVPPHLSGFFDVPDSVTILGFPRPEKRERICPLAFGRDSKLEEIRGFDEMYRSPRRLFLRVSSAYLKNRRNVLEFERELSFHISMAPAATGIIE
jgi:hypothetical protein